MTLLLVFAFVGLWLALGALSLIHWWTKDFDLTTADLPVLVIGAILGPLAYPIGFCIHGDHDNPTVLVKKQPPRGWDEERQAVLDATR